MTSNTFSRGALIILLITTMIVSSFSFLPAKRAQALAVPTTCGLFDVYCIMDNWKEFVGNRLAVMVANQLIQRMTASVVNWINTGFEGSPAFLTNPEGFFLDVGDQITGELIDKTGALSQLCSPFSFDIRLNLAINQVDMSSYNKRYTCTLGKVINNTRNAVNTAGQNSGITLSGSRDGVALGNFIDGDFSQGGWWGFVAYSTEPQNNPIGAYLMADLDLQSKIAEKKASVNADLNRGQGFLSWQKCTDVTTGYTSGQFDGGELGLSVAQEQQLHEFGEHTVVTGQTDLNKATSIKKVKKNGVVAYKSCETQTPGSMIAGSLQRQLNVPTDKLVLVKTISDSIDAITGALVNQMFTQGLAALSGRGSGTGGNSKSYLTQLSEESYNQNSFDARSTRDRTLSSSNSIINLGQSNITTYDETLASLNTTRSKYTTARACFTTKILANHNISSFQRTYAERLVYSIDQVLAQNIDPQIASTTYKKDAVATALGGYRATASTSITQIRGVTDNDISQGFNRVDTTIDATLRGAQAGIESSEDARAGKKTADTLVVMLNKDADMFQGICNAMPYQIGFDGALPYHRFQNPLLSGIH